MQVVGPEQSNVLLDGKPCMSSCREVYSKCTHGYKEDASWTQVRVSQNVGKYKNNMDLQTRGLAPLEGLNVLGTNMAARHLSGDHDPRLNWVVTGFTNTNK